MKTLLHLENIVNLKTLQRIQDDFSEATGFAAITVDFRGKPITKHSGCSKYCHIIRSREETRELCEKCDSRAGLEAARTGKPYIFLCHSGFIAFAAPIVVDGQYLGAIMGGQVVSSEEVPNVKCIIDEVINIEEDVELIEAYTQIPIVPFKKIKSAANLMFTIAKKIAEKGYVNAAKEELQQQSMRLVQSDDDIDSLQSALDAAELKIMQTQDNRQFIIQTLNTIGNLSFLEKAKKTGEVTFALSDIVKYLMTNVSKDVSIEEELSYIENYLFLQKTRLGNRLSYEISVVDEAEKIVIPSMLLQPIVENAIVHGLEIKPGFGMIKISVQTQNDEVVISIEDNGKGMSKQIVESVLSLNDDAQTSASSLKMLQQRLKERYSRGASIRLESSENKGTVVTIVIPYVN
ncbi:hypothetical protein BKP45_01705 [Anaerobacillus alkalidiazotrophicus]|uniref:Histidine kinase domain-containing protein n=1 Tax=Anaerobacillus alkalidiazotrophicus TaxID=472963 RepID=A0A1S2MA12_9BACI|nr:PocR ligand-binding domain-containing protein [Anaerobacillus alkalidiazotrophicus]OIJ21509.1 hypothetical protein BKP45_01705 [Anaerobacillus alkalidiazotrophicus]